MLISLNKGTKDPRAQFAVSILLFFSLLVSVNAVAEPDKSYLRLEQNKSSEKNDLKISSIGGLAFKGNTEGHIDLSYLESEIHGNEMALELGGGYVFIGDVSLFFGIGVSLGYNQLEDGFVGAYYPEVGIVLDVTKTFGITITAKRFYNRYEENEDIVMMGVVFRE